MAALPRAFAMLGVLLAGGFLLLMAYMTHWRVCLGGIGARPGSVLAVQSSCAVPLSRPARVQRLDSSLATVSPPCRCAGRLSP